MQWLKSNQEILLIILVGFVLRLSFVGMLHQSGYTGDEREYVYLATKVSEGGDFLDSNGEWSTKAPLWPYLVALSLRLAGDSLLIPFFLNLLAGSMAVYLTFRLCLELFGRKILALVSASLAALYPGLIIYSDILQSEAVYIVFFLASLIAVERLRKEPTMIHATLLGVFGGLASLTRAVFFGFFIILLLYIVWENRRTIRTFSPRIAIALLVWMIVLLPWTIRNFEIHHTFVPVSSWGGMSLLLGNNPYSTGTWSSKPGFEEWFATEAKDNGIDLSTSTEIQRSTLGEKAALEFIRTQPGDAVQLAMKKFYMHWVYPITNSDSNTTLQLCAVASDIILYLLAGIGVILFSKNKTSILLLPIIFFTAMQVVLHCEARYRLPIMPLVVMFSAGAVIMLADRNHVKEFFSVGFNRAVVGSWIVVVAGVYSFTALEFLRGTI